MGEESSPVGWSLAPIEMFRHYWSGRDDPCLYENIGIHDKGWIQLALRSGQVLKLNAAPIYDGEYKGYDRIKDEHVFETKMEVQPENKIIGYVGFLKLKNGFEKTIYMTKEELHVHFSKYSKNNYNKTTREWKGGLITIDMKSKITVLKQLISKWAPKDPSMDLALKIDGATFDEKGTIEQPTLDFHNAKKSVKRVAADKDLIKAIFPIIGGFLKEQEISNTQKDMLAWCNTKAKESGIDFGISNGWYGITIDELKAFCIVVEAALGQPIIVNGRRLSGEKVESEKDKEYDL